MNRLLQLMLLGIQGLVFTASSAYGAETDNFANCLHPALCHRCKLERIHPPSALGADSHPGACPKTALALFPLAESLITPYPELFRPLGGTAQPEVLWGTFLPDGAPKPGPEGMVRPRTGAQLYGQRLATLQAGQLYSRISPSTFAEQWQTTWQHPTYEQWLALLAQEAGVMATRQGRSPLTVVVGDSLCLWLPQEHLSSQRLWLNQSISGETTSHILQRLSYFSQVRPEVIYVMAGVNDLKLNTDPGVVAANLELIAQRLRFQHPQARVVVLSILPTRLPTLSSSLIQQTNRQVARAVRRWGAEFVDLQPAFTDGQGLLHPELTTDGIHLSPRGYSLLATQLN